MSASARLPLVLAASLLLGGCGSGTPQGVAVSIDELTISLTPERIPAGPVLLTVANAGPLEHQMLLVRANAATDRLPDAGPLIDESTLDALGGVPKLEAGENGSLKLDNLTPGRYLLLCMIPGHYKLGIHADLNVQ